MQQLEEEQCQVREEQQHHQEQLAKFLVQFQEEVKKTEKIKQVQTTETEQTTVMGAVGALQNPKASNQHYHHSSDLILCQKMKHHVSNGFGKQKKH